MATEMINGEKAKRKRAAFPAWASSDFYTGAGWVAGFLITVLMSAPVIYFLVINNPADRRDELLRDGIAAAWWLNPISLAALGYVFRYMRIWRFWTVFA